MKKAFFLTSAVLAFATCIALFSCSKKDDDKPVDNPSPTSVFTYNDGFTTDGSTRAAARQADGKIVLALAFGSAGMRRLNADGTTDNSFNYTLFNPDGSYQFKAVAVQDDGKIVVGGKYGGTGWPGLFRLNSDGSADNAFNANAALITANGFAIYAVTILPDSKMLIGGDFVYSAGGTTYRGLARLNANGTIDNSFIPPITSGSVYAITVLSDGRILAAGDLRTGSGANLRYGVVRFTSAGNIDQSFTFNQTVESNSFNQPIEVVTVLASGKIIIGGLISRVGGVEHEGIVKLNADGSIDETFTGSADRRVTAVVQLSDGRLLIGSSPVNGKPLVLKAENGATDTTKLFNVGFPSGPVDAIVPEAENRYLFIGLYSVHGGFQNIVRATKN